MIRAPAAAIITLIALASSQAWAGMEEAMAAAKRGDYQTAYAEWLPLANQGNPSAQHNIAQLFRRGKGVKRDYAEASFWYRLAAEQWHVPAQHNLAVMYDRGLGVPINYEEARKWYRRAADRGYGAAALR